MDGGRKVRTYSMYVVTMDDRLRPRFMGLLVTLLQARLGWIDSWW